MASGLAQAGDGDQGGGDPPPETCGYHADWCEIVGISCFEIGIVPDFTPAGVNRTGIVVGHRWDCDDIGVNHPEVWYAPDGIPFEYPLPWAYGDNDGAEFIGITDDNVAYGVIDPADGISANTHLFRVDLNRAVAELFPIPKGLSRVIPAAVNNHGQVVGVVWSQGGGIEYSFVWEQGVFTPIEVELPARYSGFSARDINDRGTVTGVVYEMIDADGNTRSLAWVLRDGEFRLLPPLAGNTHSETRSGWLNDHDEVLVKSMTPGGTVDRAYVWSPDASPVVVIEGDGPGSNSLNGINNEREVVGAGFGASYRFLWRDGRFHSLDDLIENHEELVDGYAKPRLGPDGSIVAMINDGCALVRPLVARNDGDVDGDCAIGRRDLAELLAAWGTDDRWADLDESGVVGLPDLLRLLSRWTG